MLGADKVLCLGTSNAGACAELEVAWGIVPLLGAQGAAPGPG